MPGHFTLGHLHNIIQAVMGWEDCHMHEFDVRD
ncbi:MAG TPA: plasmid pRiA4b ORF-3 family protein, partial [Bacillota bacterium]|nr:plasmid pRiA4b ORF-3 family protein [Bacillota bacterium]